MNRGDACFNQDVFDTRRVREMFAGRVEPARITHRVEHLAEHRLVEVSAYARKLRV